MEVHTVGLPAIDMISKSNYASYDQVEEKIWHDISRPIILFTQHSVTTEFDQSVAQILPSLKALKRAAENGIQVIITYPNNDAGGLEIIDKINEIQYKKIKIYKFIIPLVGIIIIVY